MACRWYGMCGPVDQFANGKATKGAFPLVILEWCGNLLATASTDGILITAGEQETYALWYLQECEGARRDVSIVNLNLLQDVWYIQKNNNCRRTEREVNPANRFPIPALTAQSVCTK